MLKFFSVIAGAGLLLVHATIAQAMPTLDGGWFADNVPGEGVASDSSPYVFTLTDAAWLRATDAFIATDTIQITDAVLGVLLTTTPTGFAAGFGDNAQADAAWVDPAFDSGEVMLMPGDYDLTVTIIQPNTGIFGAGVFVRLDSKQAQVPVPAALALIGSGLVGLIVVRRRQTV